jgi:hypothetical protein
LNFYDFDNTVANIHKNNKKTFTEIGGFCEGFKVYVCVVSSFKWMADLP